LHPIADAESEVIEHMNADHAHNLIDYCRHVHGKNPATVLMVGVDCDGFDVRADDEVCALNSPAK